MKKRNYEIPTMKVVKLQHRTHLLQASGQASGQVSATMSGTFTEETIEE